MKKCKYDRFRADLVRNISQTEDGDNEFVEQASPDMFFSEIRPTQMSCRNAQIISLYN